ncbi:MULTISPECIES: DedA family protein [Nocardiaceae]|uniref:Membrane protein DedA with SNARE-associated domain n=1 Tax=Rhodococcoides corynebacterioides TaxID=53972 RepID=A0ABS2KYP1_9NOCA|nr:MULTISPECIES: DedA family protein [Rhodococcus]MBM7417057.1 membrane protein DedA with SNARE-associated domain [Rhodococcus corynebacterioides]MBP1115310.1 membrane protein DedA with SNARE-associated domain [Rhodococcus sp. PvP016]
MTSVMERLLDIAPIWVFLIVFLLVFLEDAIFVGFVIPGETAAVIGGVAASQDHVSVVAMAAVVVVAAVLGDSVGFEIGKHFGPRLLAMKILDKRRDKLDKARDLLARKGGTAVFLGRFVAFFRAVMPALAGMSRMPYPKFLAYNALGGLVWGTGFVVLGFVAGNSYEQVAKTVGRDAAIIVVAVVVIALIVWRVRAHRSEKGAARTYDPSASTDSSS